MTVNIKLNSYLLIKIGIFGYLCTLLFNGVLKHIGLSVGILERIRPYIPEMFLMLAIAGYMIGKKSIKKSDCAILAWIVVVCLLSMFHIPSMTSVLSTIRDLIEPFIILFLLSTRRFEDRQYVDLQKMIEGLFIVFSVVGLYFSVVQKMHGSEWTSSYFIGYAIWGTESGIRVSGGLWGFKVLGTTASAETFGFYNMLALILILTSRNKKILKIGLTGITLVNMLLSGMKTPLLISALVMFILLMRKFGRKAKRYTLAGVAVLGIFLFYYMTSVMSSWSESSFYDRLLYWKDLLSADNMISLLLPWNAFYYSDKSGNTGVISFWDNSYFYLAYSMGIVGLILVLRYLLMIYRKLRITALVETESARLVLFTLIFSSVTTCIFIGRNYVSAAFIMIGIAYSEARKTGRLKAKDIR